MMKNKPIYHQSNIVNYFKCPRKFELSLEHDIKTSKVMDDGNLFEGLVYGFKDSHYEGQKVKRGYFSSMDGVNAPTSGKICDYLIENKAFLIHCTDQVLIDFGKFKKIVKKLDFSEFVVDSEDIIERVKDILKCTVQPKTLEAYERAAKYIKDKYFKKGKPYQKLTWEGKEWGLEGEADWIGEIEIEGVVYKNAIPDLKFTGSIEKIWNEKQEPEDFLQSIVYPYIQWKNTGKIPVFVYIVVENIKSLPEGADPVCKPYIVQPDLESFDWLEGVINTVYNDWEKAPNLNHCISGPYWNIRCQYFVWCKSGRRVLEQPVKINYIDLIQESN